MLSKSFTTTSKKQGDISASEVKDEGNNISRNRFKVKYDKRDLRFSSYAHENNVKSVEKMLFKNMYLHQEYKP